jgi:fructosamine-3-kinase
LVEGALRTALERTLGARLEQAVVVHGGDVAASYRIDLANGRRLFAKTIAAPHCGGTNASHPAPPVGFFTTEARGLDWLREADAVPVPQVVAVCDDEPAHLVLEWIDEGRPRSSTDAGFGASLAALHQNGASCYGREDRRTTGSRALPNEPSATWAQFYRNNRLLPLARLARESKALPEPTIDRLESLAGRLEQLGAADEPPARLHGDLWAGNRLVDTSGRSWLIDPAAHGGHREFDLAMMRLFGGFGPAAFAAYQDRHPLAEGWEDRVPLHQIAPLVVHAIKFGGGYGPAARAAIERYD